MNTITEKEKEQAIHLVKTLYKNEEGEPFVLTDKQAELFVAIYKKKHPRLHIQTTTQYGKSEVVSMAVLTRAVVFTEQWVITAGKKDKAGIIMDYLIRHIFDNDFTKSRFVMEKGESEEAIRRHRRKDRINFKLPEGTLSEILVATAENALGFGAPNVIEDESALISSQDHSMVMRMLGAQTDNFLCKIGNPFDSDHFRDSYEDDNYMKIIIDYNDAIREGRLTKEFVEEMRKQPNFGVLYEVKFPPRDQIDQDGWIPLMTKEDIDRAMIEPNTMEGFGIRKAGADIAGGGRNFSIIVNRWTNLARVSYKANERDTMTVAEKIIANKEINRLNNQDVYTDKVGIGRGVYDILRRMCGSVNGINAGDSPINSMYQDMYYNLRALMYWRLREWILGGGKLEKNDDWYQLTKVYYRTSIEGTKRGKIQIMPKEVMLKRGIDSPDVADALSLTFATEDVFKPEADEDAFFKAKMAMKKVNKDKAYNLQQVKW